MERVKGTIPIGLELPAVLLTYQQRVSKLLQSASVLIIEKSRRIGLTWGLASEAVLVAGANKMAGGMDVFYIGFNLDMTKEFIDTSAEWAAAFSHAASSVEEFLFEDIDENGKSKDIQAFRIIFDSGFKINALTSRPRSLRGRQGLVIIDEAAFHDNLKELMKAALAFLIWGGKVVVVSTHDGVANPFNEYIQDRHAGRNKYEVLKITFDDALREGLYKRICLTTGKEWSQQKEDAWRDEIISFYGEGADEELFCIPKLSSGSYLSSLLVETRMEDIPILRLECDDKFVFKSDYERERFVQDWCEENLRSLLDQLDQTKQHSYGQDFGRSGDLTVMWPYELGQTLTRRTPFTVELRNVPFKQQRQICWYILDRLPRLISAALDARGNGQQLAEETMQRYGAGRVHMVMISEKWYAEAFPKYKAAFEDGQIVIPRDADILNDHRAVKVIKGIPKIPDERATGADGGKRHGDSVVAAALGFWATLQEIVEYGYEAARKEDGHQDFMKPQAEREDHNAGRFERTGAW